MKPTTRRLLAGMLTMTLLCGTLAACRDTKEPDTTTGQSATAPVPFYTNGVFDYTIVYDKDADGARAAAFALRNAINTSTGVNFEVVSDEESETAKKEILVGMTNRSESADAGSAFGELRTRDYTIRVVNEKLVLLGGTSEKLTEAVKKFSQLYFSEKQSSLVLSSDYQYDKKGDYTLDRVTLQGKDLSEYTVVYGSGNLALANKISTVIEEKYGYALPVVEETATEQSAEILVGASKRSAGNVNVESGKYLIKQDGTKAVIAGADENMLAAGVQTFLDELLTSENATVTTDGISKNEGITTASSVKVMSLNVALSGYAENAVVNRYPRLHSLITTYAPGVVCLQEVSGDTWYDLITKGDENTPALTDTYTFVGTGRNGSDPSYHAGVTGAYNAILYNKALYKEEDSGTFWLSETPSSVSVGWDGRTRAICTWVTLTELSSGRKFTVMNTLPDSYGKKAPANGAALVGEIAASFTDPVILCADLTSSASGSVYKELTGAGFLNTTAIAATVNGTGATLNNYGGDVTSEDATDFIFTMAGKTTVSETKLITDLVEGQYVSSHWALWAEIQY